MSLTEPLKLQVDALHRPVTDVLVLDLVAAGGDDLPAWEPGAHLELEVGAGVIRHYSLCGDSVDPGRWRIAVLREPEGRGGSRLLHESLEVGAPLVVHRVLQRFTMPARPSYVFLAGGIGITPIAAMVARAEAEGADWRLYYLGRSRDRMYLADELERRWPERVVVHPSEERGRLDLTALVGALPDGTSLVCCGPDGLTHQAGAAARARGLDFHHESFGADPLADSPDDGGHHTGPESFEVELASTGAVVPVGADQTVLDAVADAGAIVVSSCREGYCGTCETAVLAGAVDHRDTVLTPEEQQDATVMMICVSRSLGPRLVLDL
ncbi:MAG: PDR/VanB family oxidoreductase [Nocardioides sp.]|uniref:PDR/VanB family oxidoreductase n=1 Tax=Nocardioides sp. TaxID=35761 RepID=UPI0039E2B2BD